MVTEKKQITRRQLLKGGALVGATAVLAACQPKVVEKIVKETVEVEKEKVVEKTVVVEKEKEVTKVVEKVVTPVPAKGAKIVRMYAQGLTPKERVETDRWDPPKEMWVMQAKYKDLHPDVEIQFTEEFTQGYEEWLNTQMVGGEAPEIVWYQRGYIARDYQKNWFVNMTPYLNEPDPYVKDNKRWIDIFQGPVIASGTAPDGNIYMITGDLVGTGVFYNKNQFTDAGITKLPTNWKEFGELQAKIKAKGLIPFSMSMDLSGGVQLWGSWITRVFQDVLYDAKMSSIKGTTEPVKHTWKPGENLQPPAMCRAIRDGKYAATDPEFKEMFKLIKDWSQYWGDGFWAVVPDDVYRNWVTKKASMGWFGSWMNKAVYNDPLRDFEWGILDNLPTITKDTSQFGGSPFPAMAGVGGVFQYAVAAKAKERGTLDATIDWMRFITAPRNLIALLNDHGGFAPGTVDVEGADPRLAVYTNMLVKYGAERIEPFDSMLTREFVDKFWAGVQKFLAGQQELDAFLAETQKNMQDAVASLLKEHPDWAEAK